MSNSIAHHEAGHVAAYLALGVDFQTVDITPHFSRALGEVCHGEVTPPRGRKVPREDIAIILFAGIHSEARYRKKSTEQIYLNQRYDRETAFDIIQGLVTDEMDSDTIHENLFTESRQVVNDNWSLIRLIADRLVIKKQLSYRQVIDVWARHHGG